MMAPLMYDMYLFLLVCLAAKYIGEREELGHKA